jgi:hypothetical protein
MPDPFSTQQIAHCLKSFEFLTTRVAPRDMRLNESRIGSVQFAIHEPAQQQLLINTGRHLLCAP